MSHPPGNDDRKQLDRRGFLKAGSLGVTVLAEGTSGCAKPASETAAPAQQGQAQRAPRSSASRFHRNFDPVPASEPSMNFAAFTDTHVGQATRSPQWDFAEHLDLLADDVMEKTLPCEFVVHLGDGAFNTTAFVKASSCPTS